jgi:ABC-type cobalt transport system substrate-binding protein
VIPVLIMGLVNLLFFELGFYGGADVKAILSLLHVFPLRERPLFYSVPLWIPLSTLIDASLFSTFASFTIRGRRGAVLKGGEGLPFLPFITLGYATALVLGDPFTVVVTYIMGPP